MIWGCIGFLVGAIGLSAITMGYHWLTFRTALNDGQYGMVFMYTLPVGAILGGVTGFALSSVNTHPVAAARACLVSGAVVFLPMLLYWWMQTANYKHTGESAVSSFYGAIAFSLPSLLWIVATVMWGVRLLRAEPS